MKKKKKSIIYKKNHVHRVNHIFIKKVLQGVFLCSIFFFIFSLLLTIKTVTYNEEPLIKTKQVLGATNLSTLLTDAEASTSADQFMPNFLLPTEASSSSSASSSALPLPTTPTPTIPLPENTIFNGNDFCLNVPVILYHHIEPLNLAQQEGHAQLAVDSSIFDEQMAYLAQKGYNTISAEQLISALLSHQQLPEKSIVVTLDDGYVDWYDYAFPVAKKYHVTLNLMIPAG